MKVFIAFHAVHLSAASALPIVKAAKAEGLPLTVETCHHYLRFFFQGCCNDALSNMIMGWRQRHMIHICNSGCSIKDQMTTLIHESFFTHINFLLLFSRIWEFVCSHFCDISIITITFMSDDIFSSVWQLKRFPPEPLNTNAVLQSGAGEDMISFDDKW